MRTRLGEIFASAASIAGSASARWPALAVVPAVKPCERRPGLRGPDQTRRSNQSDLPESVSVRNCTSRFSRDPQSVARGRAHVVDRRDVQRRAPSRRRWPASRPASGRGVRLPRRAQRTTMGATLPSAMRTSRIRLTVEVDRRGEADFRNRLRVARADLPVRLPPSRVTCVAA